MAGEPSSAPSVTWCGKNTGKVNRPRPPNAVEHVHHSGCAYRPLRKSAHKSARAVWELFTAHAIPNYSGTMPIADVLEITRQIAARRNGSASLSDWIYRRSP